MNKIGHIAALLSDGILVNGHNLATIPSNFATVMAIKNQLFNPDAHKNCPTDFLSPKKYEIQVSSELNVAPSILAHNSWSKLNKRPP